MNLKTLKREGEMKSAKLSILHGEGFNESYKHKGYIRVKCSNCEALVINGIACHEAGCDNTMHECREGYCEDCI